MVVGGGFIFGGVDDGVFILVGAWFILGGDG